jgi:iron-sulfur cluster assembly protein
MSTSTDGANAEAVAGTPLSLTERAVEAVKAALDRQGLTPEHGLRVSVTGGGCSGFQYALDFTAEPQEGDTVLEQNGVRVFVDGMALPYLQGTTIDYVTSLHAAGFRFMNPRASRTCGCGESFSA